MGGNNSGQFELSSNGDGYAFTWTEGKIYASSFTFTGDWVIKEWVQQTTTATTGQPILIAHGSNYVASYLQTDSDGSNLYAALYNGSAWGAWKTLDLPSLSSSPTGIQLATSPSGIAAVWQQADVNELNIYANVYSGLAWQTTPLILDSLAGPTGLPTVASNNSGHMAIWKQQEAGPTSPYSVYANFHDKNTWLSTAALLEQGAESVTSEPRITAVADRFAATWLQKQAGVNDVIVATATSNVWIDPVIVDTTSADVFTPTITHGLNYFSLAWRQVDPAIDPITVDLVGRMQF